MLERCAESQLRVTCPRAQSRKQRCWEPRLRGQLLPPAAWRGPDSGPLSGSFLSSPEDLVSGFEAAETPPVQLRLAATSSYGKDAGNSIPGPGNSKCKGPEAGLKGSIWWAARRLVWLSEDGGVRGKGGRRR